MYKITMKDQTAEIEIIKEMKEIIAKKKEEMKD